MSEVKVGQVYQVDAAALLADGKYFVKRVTFLNKDNTITVSSLRQDEGDLMAMLTGVQTIQTQDILFDGRTPEEQDVFLEAKAELDGKDMTSIIRNYYGTHGFTVYSTALLDRDGDKYFKLIKDVDTEMTASDTQH